MADEVTELEEVEAKLLLWVTKHDEVKTVNYELEDKVKELRNIMNMQEDTIQDQIELMTQINDLEDDLKEQKFCYELAASRAKKYKAQLTIVKEAVNL